MRWCPGPGPARRGALLAVAALSLQCGGREFAVCTSVGPPCGLTVEFEEGRLEVGTYVVTIETAAGLTTCDHVVEHPTFQDAEEAEQGDEALADCQSDGSCPDPCTGPDAVVPRSGSLTVDSDSEVVSILVENVDTGAQSSKTFTPDYQPHPARSEDCARCDVAAESMPLPT